ncbi:MAG: hypothetical protein AAGA44_16015 [Pseudomonadota bacterium]
MAEQPTESGVTVRWRTVYAAVVVFTVAVVVFLYAFSRWYAG